MADSSIYSIVPAFFSYKTNKTAKTMSFLKFCIFLLLLTASFNKASAGGFGYLACYWSCTGICFAGTSGFAAVMSAGVAAGPGMVYGAAACTTTCKAICLAGLMLPV